MKEQPGQEYRAIVQKICPHGQHGPYAVAKSDELGSVTFSLRSPNWRDDNWPEPGTYVVLWEITQKRAGWRAMFGRFVRPSDEQTKAKSKEQK